MKTRRPERFFPATYHSSMLFFYNVEEKHSLQHFEKQLLCRESYDHSLCSNYSCSNLDAFNCPISVSIEELLRAVSLSQTSILCTR